MGWDVLFGCIAWRFWIWIWDGIGMGKQHDTLAFSMMSSWNNRKEQQCRPGRGLLTGVSFPVKESQGVELRRDKRSVGNIGGTGKQSK